MENSSNMVRIISSLEKECFPGEAWSESMIASHLENGGTCEIIKDGNEAVGYILGMICLDEAEIYRIGTRKKNRRKGNGFKLVQMFIELCKKERAEKIFLEVRSENEPAIRLYKKCGFVQTAVRKDYYKGSDALIMQAFLCKM